jgi:hypothetical protein
MAKVEVTGIAFRRLKEGSFSGMFSATKQADAMARDALETATKVYLVTEDELTEQPAIPEYRILLLRDRIVELLKEIDKPTGDFYGKMVDAEWTPNKKEGGE